MSYQALARKWRPRYFADLVGQKHVIRVLENAISRDMLHHAYLFIGTRGVGKTTLARIFAKCLNCEQGLPPELFKKAKPTITPCGTCSTCLEITEGRFADLLEIDAASRTKVDQTRELLDNVPYAPTKGRYKVYLIDEVHMFSTSSFNALLKTLEEPPPHVKFLLATTDPHKLPATILSRCLQLNLRHLLPDEINKQLAHILIEEKIDHEPEALYPLAKAADGSMRDGLSLLDQAIAFGGGTITTADVHAMLGTVAHDLALDLVEAIAMSNPGQVLTVVAKIADHVSDFAEVLAGLLKLLHKIAIGQVVPEFLQDEYENPRYINIANTIPAEDVQLFYQIGLLGQRDLDLAPDQRIGLEMVLLRMLAFRPSNQLPSPQHPHLKTNPPLKTNPVGAVTTPHPISTKPTISPPKPVTPKLETVITRQEANSPPPENATLPPLTTNEDWHHLVQHLKLKGMTGELANNCELGSWDGKTLRLHLNATYGSLRAKEPEERLLRELKKHLGEQTRLDLRITKTDAETPAQRSTRERKEHLQEQQDELMQDPVVQVLKEKFQAQIIPDSIRKLDEE